MEKCTRWNITSKLTMQDFTVTTRMTKKEYARIVFFGYYKKTKIILATILGLYLVIMAALTNLTVCSTATDTSCQYVNNYSYKVNLIGSISPYALLPGYK